MKRSLAEHLEEYRASSQARKRPRTHATDTARLEDFVGAIDCDCLGEVTTADVSRFPDRKVNRDGIREHPVAPIPRPRLAGGPPARSSDACCAGWRA